MPQLRKALPAVLAAGALALGPVSAQATGSRPTGSVRLFSPAHSLVLTVHHSGEDEWIDFNPAVYLKARGTRFEIDVSRAGYGKAQRAVVKVGGRERTLPQRYLNGWMGLRKAFTLSWSTPAGAPIASTTTDWCPNDGGTSRLSPRADAETAFTSGCGYHPFTRGQRWGIDRGWARQILSYGVDAPADSLGEHAVLKVSLRKGLANAFGIAERNRTLRFDVTVKHVIDEEEPGPEPEPEPAPSMRTVTSAATGSRTAAPAAPRTTAIAPPADTLPDLIALPALWMSTAEEDGRDLLEFAATVYNGGPGPLVAEGFRRGSKRVMDAYQTFYRGTKLITTARVGTMEYDGRDSHQHWHFRDFATYDLVDKSHRRLRTSGKEAFCLAPTDGIDLLAPGAVVDPGNGDLGTACGDLSSVWVREVLAAGWGDTYTQSRAGQAIDITGLPNGTYWVRVRANPDNRLKERTRSNNVSFRRVVLGGTPGARTVRVPAYGQIDSDKGFVGDGGGEG